MFNCSIIWSEIDTFIIFIPSIFKYCVFGKLKSVKGRPCQYDLKRSDLLTDNYIIQARQKISMEIEAIL